MGQPNKELVGSAGVWAQMPTGRQAKRPFTALRLFQLFREGDGGRRATQPTYRFELDTAPTVASLDYRNYHKAAEELVTLDGPSPGPGLVAVRIPVRIEEAALYAPTVDALGELAGRLRVDWNGDMLQEMGGNDRFNVWASIVPLQMVQPPELGTPVPAPQVIAAGLRLALVETVDICDAMPHLSGQEPTA